MTATNVKVFLCLIALCSAIGLPVFQPMTDCPSIQTATSDGRMYLDIGEDIRARFSPAYDGGEIALRGESAFESNQSLYRKIQEGESVRLNAIAKGAKKSSVDMFVRNLGMHFEYVVVFHRELSAIVVTSHEGEAPVCQRLSNEAATEFVSDLAKAQNAESGTLTYISSESVYAQLGL